MPITTTAEVTQAIPLSNRLLRVILTPEHYIDYQAGQYLEIISSQPKEKLYYSIANAPLGSKTYELHIRHQPNHTEQQHVLDKITKQGRITLSLPHGDCTLAALAPKTPILFIASGTGFAPIKAMIEQHLINGSNQPLTLYWRARAQADLYLDEKVLTWEKHVPHFQYVPYITTQEKISLIEHIKSHLRKTLLAHQIVLAGPFDFVLTLKDELLKVGIPKTQLFSDVFAFTNP